MLTKGNEYFERGLQIIQKIRDTQSGAIETAADWIKDSLEKDGVWHVFGSGHSHAMCEELFSRAGGLVPVNAILDVNLTMFGGGKPTRGTNLERLEGYARIIMDNYDLRKGEILMVISNSGINAVPIEVAMIGKERGLKIIAMTNLTQSRAAKSRHSSGKKLYELADLVIDNCIDVGDACIEIAPGLAKASSLSTLAGASIVQSLVAEIAARMHADGVEPLIFTSANVPNGDAKDQDLFKHFGGKRYLNG